jgi:hypothetical protein
MKQFAVDAFFPKSLPAHRAYHSATVTCSRIAVAARRGLEAILIRDGVRGFHHHEIHLKIRLVNGQDRKPNSSE